MKIAVTYDNGNVFQHFGHTESFKIYKVEDNKIISSKVIGSEGAGHEALANLLNDKSIDVLICGGIGGGAQMALRERGIELVPGASGDADKAVEAYLKGELTAGEANCDHHEESCEHHCGEHGCHDGCCEEVEPITGPNVNKTCKVHYKGTLDDGTQFDSSYDRGEPIEFVCGRGMMIHGFDAAVANMTLGEIVNVHLEPKDAYGEYNQNAKFTVLISEMPGAEKVDVGKRVYLTTNSGQPLPAKVVAKDDTHITFDANHEMAGKALNFQIELVEIK